jgi:hypothetical protein
MRLLRAAAAALFVLALSAGTASASVKVDQALSTTVTLLFVAFILWLVGSMFSYHRYDSGGPKGGPIPKQ